MAGNTKLYGFTTDLRGVELERWGAKVKVDLGEGAVTRLRDACYRVLPKAPIQKPQVIFDGFEVEYDKDTGTIRAILSPEAASQVAVVLESYSEGLLPSVPNWGQRMRAAAQEHRDYHNSENEPGIE